MSLPAAIMSTVNYPASQFRKSERVDRARDLRQCFFLSFDFKFTRNLQI